MRNTLIMKLTFLLFILSLSACATAHKVNINAIEANKYKTFKIGIIKVAGRMPVPGGDNLEKKKLILEKIPIKDICNVLVTHYGIRVNTDINRTIKIVNEKMEGQGNAGPPPSGLSIQVNMMSENPYWGNKEYKKPSFLSGMLTGVPTIIDEDVGDTVYITYSYRSGGDPLALKDEFYYEIVVKSDNKVLMQHKGVVAVVNTPQNGLFINSERIWNNFTSYVEIIPKALERDIKANR